MTEDSKERVCGTCRFFDEPYSRNCQVPLPPWLSDSISRALDGYDDRTTYHWDTCCLWQEREERDD